MITPQEYLALDDQTDCPSEYLGGVIVPIEDASPRHTKIHGNLAYCLGDAFRQSNATCSVSIQMRVSIPDKIHYVKPDLVVTCGKEEYAGNSLLNPVLIVEILSPSTGDYDRGTKFESYRCIPSLKEYVTVAQDEPKVTRWIVLKDKWTLYDTYTDMEAAAAILSWSIPLREIYRTT